MFIRLYAHLLLLSGDPNMSERPKLLREDLLNTSQVVLCVRALMHQVQVYKMNEGPPFTTFDK